ncbi:MAG: dienelactone hydrolase family protein [Gemmatimonadaceae bacterium]|nr:dienelactone hydrolase family protein [Gemmatimonadaceae bacterium]
MLLSRCWFPTAFVAIALAAPADAQSWQNVPRAPLGTFSYDQRAPLDYREEPAASADSSLRTASVSFNSPSAGRVTGLLMRPASAVNNGRTLAGIVVLHGLPGDARGALRSQGPELAKRGAVVLAIDAPWVRRNGMPDMTTRDSVEQVQLMRDLRRAVDVLIARTDVDSTRIGYVGGSYGGAMGTLFVALEPRLRAAALFVADGGLVAHSTAPDGSAVGPLASLSAREQAAWRNAMWPIEPQRFASYITRTPVLLQNGRNDTMVSNEDAESLHKAITSPKAIEWYDSGHGLPRAAFNARVAWLTAQLGLRAAQNP